MRWALNRIAVWEQNVSGRAGSPRVTSLISLQTGSALNPLREFGSSRT